MVYGTLTFHLKASDQNLTKQNVISSKGGVKSAPQNFVPAWRRKSLSDIESIKSRMKGSVHVIFELRFGKNMLLLSSFAVLLGTELRLSGAQLALPSTSSPLQVPLHSTEERCCSNLNRMQNESDGSCRKLVLQVAPGAEQADEPSAQESDSLEQKPALLTSLPFLEPVG